MSAFPDKVPCNVINFLPNFEASNVTAELEEKITKLRRIKTRTERIRQNKLGKTKV